MKLSSGLVKSSMRSLYFIVQSTEIHDMQNTSTTQESPSSKTNNKLNLHAFLIGACFLAIVSDNYADEGNTRIEEGHTNPSYLVGADAWSATPRTASKLTNDATIENTVSSEPRHIIRYGDIFWVTDVGMLLYRDADRDGYFSGFSLSIDADTEYSHAEVYAAIDVEFPEGSRERLHTTATFHLYGNSITDEYRIDIDLVRNYPYGQYNLFVDLIDAYDHSVVDSVSATQFSNLGRLPLESEDLDNSPVTHPVTALVPGTTNNTDIRVAEYSGSSGFWVLSILGAFLFRRYHRHQGKQTRIPG